MSEPASRTASFEELYRQIERLPPSLTGEILEPGTIRTMSRPGRAHRRAAKLCADALRRFDRTLGGTGWWIEAEAELRLAGDRLVVPDLAGWRVERVPELPDENPIAIIPDWCCEVLSPQTYRIDRVVKLALYVENEVGWIWLVDPMHRTIEVYETLNGRATLAVSASDDDALVLPPFDGEVALSAWW